LSVFHQKQNPLKPSDDLPLGLYKLGDHRTLDGCNWPLQKLVSRKQSL